MPFLSNFLLPNSQPTTRWWLFIPSLLDWINGRVTAFVHGYVRRPLLVGFITVLGIGIVGSISTVYGSKLPFELFAPPSDTNQIIVKGNFSQGTELEDAQETATQIELDIRNSSESQYIEDVNYIQADESQLFLYLNLIPMEERTPTSTTILSNLKDDISTANNIDLTLGKGGAGPPTQQYQVTFRIFSEDQDTLDTVTSDLQTYLKDELNLEGGSVTKTNITNLDTITTQDGERFAAVQTGVSDPNNTELISSLRDKVTNEFNTSEYRSENDLSEDSIRTDLGQQGENLQSFKSALFAMGVAIIAMYMLLVLQFNSFLQPFLILSAIPLSLPGVTMGLFYTGNALSFFATIGVIGLAGVVVNNTIILIDAANQYRRDNNSLPDSITKAVKLRFRPLVTTTLTTLAGMLPLALSDPFWEGLAFALVFGLLSSTIFVLLLFPAFYIIVEKIRQYRLKTVLGAIILIISLALVTFFTLLFADTV